MRKDGSRFTGLLAHTGLLILSFASTRVLLVKPRRIGTVTTQILVITDCITVNCSSISSLDDLFGLDNRILNARTASSVGMLERGHQISAIVVVFCR